MYETKGVSTPKLIAFQPENSIFHVIIGVEDENMGVCGLSYSVKFFEKGETDESIGRKVFRNWAEKYEKYSEKVLSFATSKKFRIWSRLFKEKNVQTLKTVLSKILIHIEADHTSQKNKGKLLIGLSYLCLKKRVASVLLKNLKVCEKIVKFFRIWKSLYLRSSLLFLVRNLFFFLDIIRGKSMQQSNLEKFLCSFLVEIDLSKNEPKDAEPRPTKMEISNTLMPLLPAMVAMTALVRVLENRYVRSPKDYHAGRFLSCFQTHLGGELDLVDFRKRVLRHIFVEEWGKLIVFDTFADDHIKYEVRDLLMDESIVDLSTKFVVKFLKNELKKKNKEVLPLLHHRIATDALEFLMFVGLENSGIPELFESKCIPMGVFQLCEGIVERFIKVDRECYFTEGAFDLISRVPASMGEEAAKKVLESSSFVLDHYLGNISRYNYLPKEFQNYVVLMCFNFTNNPSTLITFANRYLAKYLLVYSFHLRRFPKPEKLVNIDVSLACHCLGPMLATFCESQMFKEYLFGNNCWVFQRLLQSFSVFPPQVLSLMCSLLEKIIVLCPHEARQAFRKFPKLQKVVYRCVSRAHTEISFQDQSWGLNYQALQKAMNLVIKISDQEFEETFTEESLKEMFPKVTSFSGFGVQKNIGVKQCGFCHVQGSTLRCGGCKQIYYCNRICQKKHWKKHKKECKKLKKGD